MRLSVIRAIAVAGVLGIITLLMNSCGNDGLAVDSSEEKQAIARYQAYLGEHIGAMTTDIEELIGPIRTGKAYRSQSLYVIVRVPYGQIEPGAELFADLDSRILGGLHRLEKTLWVDETVDGLKPVAKQLLADSKALDRRVKSASLPPDQIAVHINAVLREASQVKLAGKEQPYSDADLVDVAANLEGARAAYESLKPLLDDQQQLREIDTQFDAAYAALRQYGALASDPAAFRPKAAGAIFVQYYELTQEEIQALSRKVNELASSLSRALAPVINSGR